MISRSILVVFWVLSGLVILGLPFLDNKIETGVLIKELEPLYYIPQISNSYLYLIHHLFAVVPVFIFGIVLNWFGYKDIFKKEFVWPVFGFSVIYIFWDFAFTKMGIWGFEESLYLGVSILGLPMEEICWFFIIPFCSIFIIIILEQRIELSLKTDGLIKVFLIIVFTLSYLSNLEYAYSVVSFGSCIVLLHFGWQWREPGFGVFALSFLIILIPMFIFNGMLTGLFTGKALVQYNPMEFSGIRLGSFPMEDLGFGFGYLYGIVKLRNYLKQRRARVYTV